VSGQAKAIAFRPVVKIAIKRSGNNFRLLNKWGQSKNFFAMIQLKLISEKILL